MLSTVIFNENSIRNSDPRESQSSTNKEFSELRSLYTEDPRRSAKERLHMPDFEEVNATFTAASPHFCSKPKLRAKSRTELKRRKRSSSYPRNSVSKLLKSVPDWKKDVMTLLTQVAKHMQECSGFRSKLSRRQIPLLDAFHKVSL
jgi:hypothetical protein